MRAMGTDGFQERFWDSELVVFQGDSRPDLIRLLQQVQGHLERNPQTRARDLAYTLNTSLEQGSARLAIVAVSTTDLREKLSFAVERLKDPERKRIKDLRGIFYFDEPLAKGGDLAFLFPGEGSQYLHMLEDLCLCFDEVRESFDFMDRVFAGHRREMLPSQVIFPAGPPDRAQEEKLWQMDFGTEVIFAANRALFRLLSSLEIRPRAMLGHSTGEYSALIASGAIQIGSEEELEQRILELNRLYDRELEAGNIPHAALLTVGGVEREKVLEVAAGLGEDLRVAMDNCPHQIVLAGGEATVAKAKEQLQGLGAVCSLLPFSRAYHTPAFRAFSERLRGYYAEARVAAPQVDLYSCATAGLYPRDPQGIRELALAQWSSPVRFRETIEAMYAAGVRIFVEVGPRGNLTAFVDDILRKRPYLAIASNLPNRSGISQLHHCLGLLAAHGVSMNLEPLYRRRNAARLPLSGEAERNGKDAKPPLDVRLSLGLPLLKIEGQGEAKRSRPPISRSMGPENGNGAALPSARPSPPAGPNENGSRGAPADRPGDPGLAEGSSAVMEAYLQTMSKFLRLQQEVMQAYLGRSGAPQGDGGGGIPTAAPSLPPGGGIEQDELLPDTGAGSAQPACALEEVGVEAEAPEAGRLASEGLKEILLDIVSERSGYPADLLGLDLNLEADLGIDSIKRVEILGAFQRQTGLLQGQDMEQVAGLKTLGQILEYLEKGPAGGATQRVAPSSVDPPAVTADDAAGEAGPGAPTAWGEIPAGGQAAPAPLIGEIQAFVPGEEITALRRFSLNEDLFLRHHTLGRQITTADPDLPALAVMPLAMSLEMMAEGARLLLPERVVTGLRGVKAYRWILFEAPELTLRLSARRAGNGEEEAVQVQVWLVKEGDSDQLALEGIVLLAEDYPEAPAGGEFSLRAERPSRWEPEKLYAEGMFNGPTFQGVASIERTGEDGAMARLQPAPQGGQPFFRSQAAPEFLVDPVLLDAAGQVVGFWTAEHLETGFVIFPFSLDELALYGPALPAAEGPLCRARIRLLEGDLVSSDLEILRQDGRLHMRIRGWKDKRYNISRSLSRLVLAPREHLLSRIWPAPVAAFPHPESVRCCLIPDLAIEAGEQETGIWQRVIAHLILTRGERAFWQALPGPPKRRSEWLLGRLAAKDAVRLILKERCGLELFPADIEILPDEWGQPQAAGAWEEALGARVLVTISHSGPSAAAIAGLAQGAMAPGLDIERLGAQTGDFIGAALTPEEIRLLGGPDQPEYHPRALRFWAAKEAVTKALGRGIIEKPMDLVIQEFDPQAGQATVAPAESIRRRYPELNGARWAVYTIQEGELVAASTWLERS